MTLQLSDDFSDNLYEYAFEMEKEWRATIPRFSDEELLEIFPEIKQIIPEKLKELEKIRQYFCGTIKRKLMLVKNAESDEFSKWFWREWIKASDGAELLKVEKQIKRLKRFLMVRSGGISKGSITEEQIQKALLVPIENLINGPLRKNSKTITGLCPLHQEKHPSFCIYTQSNSFYCFGCNQGGDAISFIRLLHGYSFKEAINYLTN
jgi:hypothetical protein